MDQKQDNFTIHSMIAKACETFADRPALGFAFKQPLTYEDLGRKIRLTAESLRHNCIRKGDRIGILAENSPDWGVVYLAGVSIGAVIVPVLPDFTEADVLHILDESRVKLLFITEKQIPKIVDISQKNIRKVITLDNSRADNHFIKTESLADFIAKSGNCVESKATKEIKKIGVTSEDIASIIYTSGTSGHSKAVMLRHGNFTNNVRAIEKVVAVEPDWTFLSVLPMSHAYEFTVGFLMPLSHGARLVYCDRPPTPTILEAICRTEKPTAMCVVPMIMEKIYKKKILPVLQANAAIKAIMKIPMLRKMMLRKIRERLIGFFGGELKIMAIGGAALNWEVESFMRESGFPFIVGYGLTESAPLLAGGPVGDLAVAPGSCGKPINNVEIRIQDPDPQSGIGGILARGPNVMAGYFNNPEATAQTITEDGWLVTGDLGKVDENGNLFVTGRVKNVIVLSHGENIYPETIEEKINSAIFVSESLVVVDDDTLKAMVFPDYDYINRATRGKSQREKEKYITGLLRDLQKEVNRQLPPYSRLKEMVERPEPFTKTATRKIKRYLYT